MKKMLLALLCIIAIAGIAGTGFFYYQAKKAKLTLAAVEKETVSLQEKLLKLMEDQKSMLENYNQLLQKELVAKYVEYILSIRAKILSGKQVVTQDEKKTCEERIAYVREMLPAMGLTEKHKNSYLAVLDEVSLLLASREPSH